MEAKWLLANIYDKTGRLGLMMEVMRELGIREAEESQFAYDVVSQGARGYVIALRQSENGTRSGSAATDDRLLVDLTAEDGVEQGDEMVVYEEGAVLRHPVTLEILDIRVTPKASAVVVDVSSSYTTVQVEQVYGEASSFVIPGEGQAESADASESPETAEEQLAAYFQSAENDPPDLRVAFRDEFEDFLYDRSLTQAQATSTTPERAPAEPDYETINMSANYDGVGLSGAEGFNLLPDGEVFVADTQNHRIVQLDGNGEFVTAVGFQGSGPDEFQQPVDIELFNDQLIVVERVNHRLNILDQDLNNLDIVGSRGTGAVGLFERPSKAISYRNELYVLDSGNQRVQVFDGDLEPTGVVYNVGDAEDEPTSFTIIPNQSVVVVDYVGNQVFYYNIGEPDSPARVEELPGDVAGSSISDVSYLRGADGRDLLAYALDGEHQLALVDAETQELVDTVGRRGRGEGQFNEPVQVKLQGGELVVLERRNNRLQIVRDLP
jgi:hypothetical protein